MKQASRYYVFFVALCLSSPLSGSKFGIWQDIYMEKAYGPWILQFNQEAQFKNRGKHLFYELSDIGYWYTGIAKWIAIGIFYRYFMYEPVANQQFVGEHGPHFDIRTRATHNDFLFQHRLRIHYISGPLTHEEWIMRNEFLVSYKTRFLELFASVEPYYNLTTKKLPINYLVAGIGKQIGEHFNGKIYYRNEQFPHRVAERVHHFLGCLITLAF